MKKILGLIVIGTFLASCSTLQKKTASTAHVQRYFNSIKGNKKQLQQFFQKMPKGGDLHHHASGTPFAEEYIEIALKDSCYINPYNFQLYADQKSALSKKDTAARLLHNILRLNNHLKDAIIDNWSVRNYKKNGKDAHDLFFSTFGKFKPAFVGHESELLSRICKKASADNIAYIETMIRVPNIQDKLTRISDKKKWNADQRPTAIKLDDFYAHFKKEGISSLAQANADSLSSYYSRTNKHGVALKFQTYGVRVSSNQPKIFGQLILAFETALVSEHLVGINFVAPEDHSNALKNYTTHMQMFQYLKNTSKYAGVNVALHAGELVLGKGKTAEKDLKFHITEALKIANAKRIGHGVALSSETDFEKTLDFMRENNCAVEINLESNAVILGTNKQNHPINIYLKHNIPVCIATDDAGVLRTNLTNQYVLLSEYVPNISYAAIKKIVKNSISHSFLKENKKEELKRELALAFKQFEKEISTRIH